MRIIYKIFTLLLVAFSAVMCTTEDEVLPTYEKATLVHVGDPAPDFTVNLLSGEQVTLSQLQGKTVLLVFFNSTCSDCQQQLELLDGVDHLFSDYKFELLAISRGEKRSVVREYIERNGYQFSVGTDTNSEIYSLYATHYVPRCFVIDSLGRVVAISAEYKSAEFEVILKVIEQLTSLSK